MFLCQFDKDPEPARIVEVSFSDHRLQNISDPFKNATGRVLPCSVADLDPGSGAFMTPGSGIRIRDEHFESHFRELRNNFLG